LVPTAPDGGSRYCNECSGLKRTGDSKEQRRPLAVHQACSADLTTLHLDDVTVTYHADTRRLALELGGLATGFGGKATGVLFLLASADVGGDSCFGLPSADRMIAVPL
jgi:hypothetical protein